MGLEDLRYKLQQNKQVSETQMWQTRIQGLKNINPYLPAILKWHGLHRYNNAVDTLQYDKMSSSDTVACIQGLVDLGLIDGNFKIIDKYRPQLSKIAESVYQTMMRQKSGWDPNVFTFYSWPDKFNVTVKSDYYGGLRRSIRNPLVRSSTISGGQMTRPAGSIGSNLNQSSRPSVVNQGSSGVSRPLPVMSPKLQDALASSGSQGHTTNKNTKTAVPEQPKSDAPYRNLKAMIERVRTRLAKLKYCSDTAKAINNNIFSICRSTEFYDKCSDFVLKEIKSQRFADVRSTILAFEDLFGKMYAQVAYGQTFRDGSVLYEKYWNVLNTELRFVEQAIRSYDSNPYSLTEFSANSYIQGFYKAGYEKASEIDEIYANIQDLSCPIDKMIQVFMMQRDQWKGKIRGFNHGPKIAFEQNVRDIVLHFKEILDCPLNDEYFEAEIEKYRKYVHDLIIKETVTYDTAAISEELQNMPIDQLNKDKSGFRISLLVSYGINTILDIYMAQVQNLYAIKGISENKAYEMKYKAEEIASLVTTSHQKVEPLKINYDNHSDTVSNIVLAIYVYRMLLNFRQRVKEMGFIDLHGLRNAVACISLFNMNSDWLFYTVDEKTKFCQSYSYLASAMDDPKYQNHRLVKKYVVDNVQNFSVADAWRDFRENTVAYYNCIEGLVPSAFESGDHAYGLPEELARQIEEQVMYPDGLTCELRRYQLWGVKYILHQGRVLLGDEMGLGKTIQAIASMVSLKNVNYDHFIVICPASVVVNWFKEVRRFSKLQPYKGHGTAKERNKAVKAWKYHGGVLITNYETYPNLGVDNYDEIGMVVVDEAHYIKNPDAARSIHVRKLCERVSRVLFLTGTALENKVDEMLSLIEVLNRDVANKASAYTSVVTSRQFKDAVAPVYFRRKQRDVNQELPEKIEEIAWCTMGSEEQEAYEMLALTMQQPFMGMRQVSWMMDDLSQSSKAMRLQAIVEEAVADDRKVIVFSNFRHTIAQVRKLFAGHCTDAIDGSVSPEKRQGIIDNFAADPDLHVLASQIQAGGTGLNIQSASVVVMCEPQIKPSLENQAIARAHRMGQSRSVLVYRLCCADSIDERMLDILEQKQQAFDTFADQSVSGEKSLELNNTDVSSMVAEEIESIKARRKNKKTVAFKDTEEGKKWHIEEDGERKGQYERIENMGRERTVTDAQRQRILRRDNFTCQLCGAKGPGAGGSAELHVDHKKPFSNGGSDDDDNLWTLCAKCNLGKSNKYDDTDLANQLRKME